MKNVDFSKLDCFIKQNSYLKISHHVDLSSLHLLHKTCWVELSLGSLDWSVRVNAYTCFSGSDFSTIGAMHIRFSKLKGLKNLSLLQRINSNLLLNILTELQ